MYLALRYNRWTVTFSGRLTTYQFFFFWHHWKCRNEHFSNLGHLKNPTFYQIHQIIPTHILEKLTTMFIRDFCFWNNWHLYGYKLNVLSYVFLKSKKVWIRLRCVIEAKVLNILIYSTVSDRGQGAQHSYTQKTYSIILSQF